MDIKLHANATTTPATRAYIAASTASVRDLSAQLGVSETTIRRWRQRPGEVLDRSHRPHEMHTSTDPMEEAIICDLRRSLGLSLDDITEVMRRCVDAKLTRSSIHRCLVRHGLSKRPPDLAAKRSTQPFAEEGCGFIHMDLKHLPSLRGQPAYVFVAIDRATRYVFVEIHTNRTAETTTSFLRRFVAHFPHKIRVIVTDNGSEFTDRFSDATRDKPPANRPAATPSTANAANSASSTASPSWHPRRPTGNAFIKQVVHDYNRTKLRCLDYKAPLEILDNLTGHNRSAAPLIEGGLPTERLLAYVAVAKYADGLPLYRQEGIYAHDGVDLGRTVMAGWMGKVGFHLEPLAERILDLIRSGERVFVDETTLPTLAPGAGRTQSAWLWTYARDDRPFGSTGPPMVAYRFEDSRAGECPERHLAGFRGLLQTDGYAA